jgi:hypothetical protein
MSLLTMYRPNFCSQCGEKIIRLRWRLWTSRRFCDSCLPQFRRERWLSSSLVIATFVCVGFISGRALKSNPAPLVIQRSATAPTSSQQIAPATGTSQTTSSPGEERVYICGARTKKGTPCSRRVHGPIRCWQHKGMPAILPPDKLIVKD